MIIDHQYDSARDIHWYHLGYQHGDTYQKFYRWLRGVRIHYDYTDMPHHWFVLLHDSDRRMMHALYGACIGPMRESEIFLDDFIDLTKLAEPTPEEAKLSSMLTQGITRELNNEAIQLLRRCWLP